MNMSLIESLGPLRHAGLPSSGGSEFLAGRRARAWELPQLQFRGFFVIEDLINCRQGRGNMADHVSTLALRVRHDLDADLGDSVRLSYEEKGEHRGAVEIETTTASYRYRYRLYAGQIFIDRQSVHGNSPRAA